MLQFSGRDAEEASCQRDSTSVSSIKKSLLMNDTAIDLFLLLILPPIILFFLLPCLIIYYLIIFYYDVKFHCNNIVIYYMNTNQPMINLLNVYDFFIV